jgi:aryl-alcohol dehydrogenase-like predicted oxidoreductase
MKLALGTAQFGQKYGVANTVGQVNKNTAHAIIHRCKELGWDTLDTAITYGESESILGTYGVEQWNVVSKLPAVPEKCQDVGAWAKNQAQKSLRRLGIKKLYGLLLHRPGQLTEDFGIDLYRALQTLKVGGLVEKIGVSIYSPSDLELLWPKYRFDLVQAPLNIVDRRLLESGWADRLKLSGAEIHVRSVFLQGLMLIPPDKRPSRFGRWPEIWDEWDHWLNVTKLTPIQACLRFANLTDTVDRIVVGVDSGLQLEEIATAIDGKLDSLPNFRGFNDERLINPAKWIQL